MSAAFSSLETRQNTYVANKREEKNQAKIVIEASLLRMKIQIKLLPLNFCTSCHHTDCVSTAGLYKLLPSAKYFKAGQINIGHPSFSGQTIVHICSINTNSKQDLFWTYSLLTLINVPSP